MPHLPILPECYTVFVSGPVSSGKTWLMRQWALQKERVLVQDVTFDFSSNEYTHIWSNPEALCDRIIENPYYYRIAYHVNAETIQDDFRWLFNAAWTSRPVLSRWLFIDEVKHVCQNQFVHPCMKIILQYSRHILLGVVAASQRIAEVDKSLTDAARMTVLFHTDEATSLDAIYNRWGKEVSDAVSNLRPCIYDDVNKIVHQEPECVVVLKGRGFKVIALGSKIQSAEESQQWEQVLTHQDEDGAEPHSEPSNQEVSSEESGGSRE